MLSADDSDTLHDAPLVSVIVTTYDEDIYDDFALCVESVLSQTYEHIECVIVTETDAARDGVTDDFAERDGVVHVHATDSLNLAKARNLGADRASGDIYAFIDDDAEAVPNWVSCLVDAYLQHDALAAGGKLTPEWCESRLTGLPDEFLWLVGATHAGFRETPGWTRNTFGANISFRADAFDALGGFDTEFGKDHGFNLQGEETELCARIRDEYGESLYYQPDAEVIHKVYDFQTSWLWIVDRAFWQGVSKRFLALSVPESTGEERDFLRRLLMRVLPMYIRQGFTRRDPERFISALAILALTGTVGIGYLAAVAYPFKDDD